MASKLREVPFHLCSKTCTVLDFIIGDTNWGKSRRDKHTKIIKRLEDWHMRS